MHAFFLLNRVVPWDSDIIGAAAHDEIFLSVTVGELDEAASPEQMLELIRCGVRYDSYTDGLAMFV